MSLKFCPKCGNKIEEESSRFCVSCGADLGAGKENAKFTSYETMDEIQPQQQTIKAPENIEYADFWARLVALIIDGIIIGIIGSVLSLIIFVSWVPFNIFDPFGGWWTVSFPFDWLIGFIYMWLLETQNQGQTVGKMAMNLRTVDEHTLGIATSRNYALNNLLKPSGFLILDLIIGFLKNSGDPKKRYRIMQYISETVVIKTK